MNTNTRNTTTSNTEELVSYDYHKSIDIPLGLGGIGKLNLYTGKLTVQPQYKGFENGVLPIYATDLTVDSRFKKIADSWNLPFYQTMSDYNHTSGTYDYYRTDAIGQKHYYTLQDDDISSGTHSASDGEYFYYNIYTSDLVVDWLTDRSGNTYNFETDGTLASMTDRNGRMFDISDTTVSVLGKTYTYTVTGDTITGITYNGKTIILSKNTNNELATITYPDGTTAAYEYTSGYLSKVTDSLGNIIEIGYDGNRVNSVVFRTNKTKVYYNSTVSVPTDSEDYPMIDSISITYGGNSTYVSGHDKVQTVYKFDAYGRTILEYPYYKSSDLDIAPPLVTPTVIREYPEKETAKSELSNAILTELTITDQNTKHYPLSSVDELETLSTTGSNSLDTWLKNGVVNICDETGYINTDESMVLKINGNSVVYNTNITNLSTTKSGWLFSAWLKRENLDPASNSDGHAILSTEATYSGVALPVTKRISTDYLSDEWQYTAIFIPKTLDWYEEGICELTSLKITISCESENTACYLNNPKLVDCYASRAFTLPLVDDFDTNTNYPINMPVIRQHTTDGIKKTENNYDSHLNLVSSTTIDEYGNKFITTHMYNTADSTLLKTTTSHEYTQDDVSYSVTDNVVDYVSYDETFKLCTEKCLTSGNETRTFEYGYNDKGQIIREAENGITKMTYTYASDNETLTHITDACGRITQYQYDSSDRLHKVINSNSENVFDYTNNMMTKLTSPSSSFYYTYNFTDTNDPVNSYEIKVGNTLLSKNESYISDAQYAKTTEKITYGNVDTIKTIIKDQYGNPTKLTVTKNGVTETLAEISYDKNGKLVSYKGIPENTRFDYTYNDDGNLSQISKTTPYNSTSDNDTKLYREYNYTGSNPFKTYSVTEKGATTSEDKTYYFTYRNSYGQNITTHEDGISRVNCSGIFSENITTDKLGRRTVRTLLNSTNNQILRETNSFKTCSPELLETEYTIGTDGITRTYNYSYDASGNITSMLCHEPTVDNPIPEPSNGAHYQYDSLNRITREDNIGTNQTIIYSYDNNGNILTKSIYPYTPINMSLPTIDKQYDFVYNTSGWNDQLLRIDVSENVPCGEDQTCWCTNSKYISYNNIGHPFIYKDNSLSWAYGNKLAFYNGISFTYASTGMRLTKGNTTYEYEGDKLIKETRNGTTIEYLYGANGIIGFRYSGRDFYYVKNALGDVTTVVDWYGDVFAKYVYDAFGNCTITQDTNGIGTLNPIRYRGYYYDTETGLYYLKTRYYDPEIGRFISPDSTKYLDPESIHGLNLYAYCLNNPVMYVDPNGNLVLSTIALSALGAFFLGGLTSVVSQGVQYGWDNISVGHAVVDGLFAAASVLIAATPISLLGSVALGSTMGIGQYLVASAFHEDAEITLSGVITAGLLGGIGGAISGAGANNMKALSTSKKLSSFTKGAVRKVLRKIDKYGLNSKQFQYAMHKYGFAAMHEINTLISKSFYEGAKKIAITIPVSAALSYAISFINECFEENN